MLEKSSSPMPFATWGNFFWLALSWPVLTSFFLLVFGIGTMMLKPETYTTSFDGNSIQFAFWTVCGHILALLSSKYILRKSIFNIAASKIKLALIVSWVVIVQSWWRFLATGMNHLDCGKQCGATIIPLEQENIITLITVSVLITLGVAIFINTSKQTNS